MRRYTSKEIVELTTAAMWPVVVVAALLMFYRPLNRILVSLADRSSDIQTVKIGGLELSIRQHEISLPSPEVTAALQQMGSAEIQRLFFHSDSGGSCYTAIGDEYYKQDQYLSALALIVMQSEPEKDAWCKFPHKVSLTQTGKDTKSFTVKLLGDIVVKKNTEAK